MPTRPPSTRHDPEEVTCVSDDPRPDPSPRDEAVRRLLADARHRGATPPDVVARLDDTLAGLVAARGSAPLADDAEATRAPEVAAGSAPVVDLAARRRRRVGAGLLAAAAVVVAGVAVGQGLPTSSGGDSSASGSADSATTQDDAAGGSSAQDPSADSQLASPELKTQAPVPEAALPTLSTGDASLADDLLALRPRALSRARQVETFGDVAACSPPGVGAGRRARVEVDGRPGVAVYRRPSAGDQRVAIYVCGTAAPVRSVTLPAP